jgi:hypothetical protein
VSSAGPLSLLLSAVGSAGGVLVLASAVVFAGTAARRRRLRLQA